MATTTVNVNVKMNETMQKQFETIIETRSNRDVEEIFQQIFERGLYDLAYRTERNKKVYAESKGLREELKALKAQLRG